MIARHRARTRRRIRPFRLGGLLRRQCLSGFRCAPVVSLKSNASSDRLLIRTAAKRLANPSPWDSPFEIRPAYRNSVKSCLCRSPGFADRRRIASTPFDPNFARFARFAKSRRTDPTMMATLIP